MTWYFKTVVFPKPWSALLETRGNVYGWDHMNRSIVAVAALAVWHSVRLADGVPRHARTALTRRARMEHRNAPAPPHPTPPPAPPPASRSRPKRRLNRLMDALNFEYPNYDRLDEGAGGGKTKRVVSILGSKAARSIKEEHKASKK